MHEGLIARLPSCDLVSFVVMISIQLLRNLRFDYSR